MEYVLETKEMPGIDVSDILALLDSKMIRKDNLEVQIIEIQKRLKDQMIIQEKMIAEEGYRREKEKLDVALAMGVISKEEYNEKLIYYKKRLDSFEEIKRIEEQYELDIITREERDIKIDEIRYR